MAVETRIEEATFADLGEPDRCDLERAARLLERSGLAVRLASLVGTPIEGLMDMLPKGAEQIVGTAVERALRYGFDVALATVGTDENPVTGWTWLDNLLSNEWVARAQSVLSGGAGGAGGLAGTVIELPVTTALILRSIAQIGQLAGEDIRTDDFRLACLSVLAMGGRTAADDRAESGYLAVRLAIADAVRKYAAGKTLSDVLPRIAAPIAQRFGISASFKFSAQLAPVVGGIAGATVNYVFMDHFQDKARGHFIVRRLERAHGDERVRSCYLSAVEDLRRRGEL